MSSVPSQWSIGAFYKKAWHVVTTYKQLWLLGFAVMVFASSSVNMNSSFDGSDFSQETEVEAQVMDADLMTVDPSLGEGENLVPEESAGAESFSELTDFFGSVMAKVNPLAWYLGGLAGTFFVALSLVNYVVAGAWSRAALILGVADATKDKTPDVTKSSVAALDYVKGVFFIGLVPWMGCMLFVIIAAIVGMIIGFLAQTSWVSVLLVLGMVVLLLGSVILTVTTINLGTREAVLFSTGGRVGLARGWQAAKKGWRKALSLLFWNIVTEVVITIALFVPAIMAFVVVVGGLTDESQLIELGFMPFIPTVVLVMLGFVAYFVFKAAYNVFTYTTWHLAHAYLRKETSPSAHT
jgi:hypothetical protein